MIGLLKTMLGRLGLVSIATTVLVAALDVKPAQAQAAYGSYVGLGGTVGLNDDDNGEGDGFGMVISGRYKLLAVPISLRAQAFLFNGDLALVPTVSYDFPVSFQTDVYLGAGVSIPTGDDASPVGDETAFVLQPGIDFAVPGSNLVVFGNAIFAFDAFEDGGTATAVQAGVGWNFGN
ncbi:MAG: porin family protein [Leptolyngbya sp. SIO3F4]|nr:porin family protein [Leptolyngbya sp. SIO3F4]